MIALTATRKLPTGSELPGANSRRLPLPAAQGQDPEVIYHNPGLSPEPNGDRLVLRTWQDDAARTMLSPPPHRARYAPEAASRRQRWPDAGRIRGYWQDAVGGYTLELEIPLSYTGGRLGFYLVNAGSAAGGALKHWATSATGNRAPPWLIYSPDRLQESLAPFSQQGSQIQVVDKDSWLIADLPARGASRRRHRDLLAAAADLSQHPVPGYAASTPPAPAPGKIHGEEIARPDGDSRQPPLPRPGLRHPHNPVSRRAYCTRRSHRRRCRAPKR